MICWVSHLANVSKCKNTLYWLWQSFVDVTPQLTNQRRKQDRYDIAENDPYMFFSWTAEMQATK
jgi:hypothetical protein